MEDLPVDPTSTSACSPGNEKKHLLQNTVSMLNKRGIFDMSLPAPHRSTDYDKGWIRVLKTDTTTWPMRMTSIRTNFN